jgi:hypothetical protein
LLGRRNGCGCIILFADTLICFCLLPWSKLSWLRLSWHTDHGWLHLTQYCISSLHTFLFPLQQ